MRGLLPPFPALQSALELVSQRIFIKPIIVPRALGSLSLEISLDPHNNIMMSGAFFGNWSSERWFYQDGSPSGGVGGGRSVGSPDEY